MKQVRNWAISDGVVLEAGSKVVYSDNQESVTLTGMVCYELTNPTMKTHRKIENITVLVGKAKPEGGVDTIVMQTRVGSMKTIPYDHLPAAMLQMLIMDSLTARPTKKVKYEQPQVVETKKAAKETKTAAPSTKEGKEAKTPTTKKGKGGKAKSKKPTVAKPAATPSTTPKVEKKQEEVVVPKEETKIAENTVTAKNLK